MLLRGFITGYDTKTLVGTVQLENGFVKAKNYIIPGQDPLKAYVNIFLIEEEKNTILPSHAFNPGDVVVVRQDSIDSYMILGKLDIGFQPVTTTQAPIYETGKFFIEGTFSTDSNGFIRIPNFARRALIRKLDIVKSGVFTCKIYNSTNSLQASWGDGEVIVENMLEDHAGFFFESENLVAVIQLLPAGSYQLSILGERFS